ncbi:DVU_1553 family AMP-dependent CoA ligase [Oleidesulfovibrio sp.]|uniref:DVU_1553 family AMP-dependent CoA ligase n=1 Tax=Oleidesulfovibrio sp. TaxID=2909707 RepID=UPI003A89FD0B
MNNTVNIPTGVFTLDGLTARNMGLSCPAAFSPAQHDPLLHQLLTPQHIATWQFEQLRRIVATARKHSSYYRHSLRKVEPDMLQARENLPLLPFTEPHALRNDPMSLLCTSQDEVARVVTLSTSGTSGNPKRLFFSQTDLDATVEFFTWGMQSVGNAGDTVMALLPDERPSSVGRLLATALENARMRPVSGILTHGGAALARQAYAEGVRVIVGSPAHVRHLAMAWLAAELPKDAIHTVLLCWDTVPETVAGLIRHAFGCRVLTHWGMTETGLGGALSCGDEGMHLREADLLAEIIDPQTGTPLPDGNEGELVITTLRRTAMPLIRYRTGDLATILPDACSCGSPLRRIRSGKGRIHGAKQLPSGELLYPADLDNILLPLPHLYDYTARWNPQLGAPLHISLWPDPQRPADSLMLEKQAASALAASPLLEPLAKAQGITLQIEGPVSQANFTKRRIFSSLHASTPPLNGDIDHEHAV